MSRVWASSRLLWLGPWLCWLLRRDTKWRMASAAGIAAERSDRGLHGRRVLRERLVAKGARAVLEVLRSRLELRPPLPDVGLGFRLRIEGALREQQRDPLRMERDCLRVDRNGLHITRL